MDRAEAAHDFGTRRRGEAANTNTGGEVDRRKHTADMYAPAIAPAKKTLQAILQATIWKDTTDFATSR